MAEAQSPRGKLTRGERIARMLAELQRDVEHHGSPEAKRRRRAILRGMRVALWVLEESPRVEEVAREFRSELFGWAPDALPSLARAEHPMRSNDNGATAPCEV
ncbi:hypothetical protein D3C77_153470 [compost metagenome]